MLKLASMGRENSVVPDALAGKHGVDLPLAVIRAGHPELVLHRVAARHTLLVAELETFALQPRALGDHLTGGADLDAEMIQASRPFVVEAKRIRTTPILRIRASPTIESLRIQLAAAVVLSSVTHARRSPGLLAPSSSRPRHVGGVGSC
jgi:hypothetical protein